MVTLSPRHHAALNRRRRITVQYDAHGQLGAPFQEWLAFRFSYLDQPGSQVDNVTWDIGWGSWAAYPSDVLPRFEHPGLRLWWDQGIDWVARLVAATHSRGLECFWNHRVSEVDVAPTVELDPGHRLMMDAQNPVKAEHPDWVIKTWWWQGLWNYAVPELRDYQLAILREVAWNYDLDGLQLDFARHIPCLPVGRQWELREGVTAFVASVREMLQEEAVRRGRPYLLAARVPETLAGCRHDGLDIRAWVDGGLVDILTLGSRSMAVDLPAFRALVGDRDVKLQPCFDDHHATDGYRYQSVEFLRGVFANWWQQGADSVATFNWPNADPEAAEATVIRRWGRTGFNEAPAGTHGRAYREIGEPKTLAGRDKVFAVERRGGYPWAEGYFNRNDGAPLPLALRHDGTPAALTVGLSDAVPQGAARLTLRLLLFGAREGDHVAARLNGVPLEMHREDHAWKDAQIFSPAPQPRSGGHGNYAIDPGQKLLCAEFRVPDAAGRTGPNEVRVAVAERAPYCTGEIVLEKLELHLRYV